MDYSFCNIHFQIKPVTVRTNSVYDPFRYIENLNDNCQIKVKWVEQLEIPDKSPVFRNLQGLYVVVDNSMEYRYYRDFFSGNIRELFIDNGKHKELHILAGTESLPELDLINCLAIMRVFYTRI